MCIVIVRWIETKEKDNLEETTNKTYVRYSNLNRYNRHRVGTAINARCNDLCSTFAIFVGTNTVRNRNELINSHLFLP